ncbi:EAL domain-containing protein [Methylomicrobium sp. Wu6]|uniref:EAL domain-containing protein n=1 Tax=Methylomicrobium sp. Wu6 TaxID=3107928 RepID=UPI002DD63789|nr:EAL domain-containing protein [Methylomicrobium sp. Wu6]MEC4748842.1 EAL domain-containing protein [Methylomicrobium sp. Wu6]
MNDLTNQPIIRLLVVDDDKIDRLACKRILAKESDCQFVIFEAETGVQGLELARDRQPDCILLDHHLPDLNGLEFLAELTKETGELPMPVIMLTVSDHAMIAVEALKLGARDYVVKDSDRESLQWLPAVVFRALREQQVINAKAEAEAKYRTLVEQIPAITYIASLESLGKLLYVSPQIEQLGFPPEVWIDEPQGLLKRIHADDRSEAIEAYSQTYESHIPLRCEYRLVKSDGQARWFLDEANVVHDEAGGTLFLQGVLVDITKDKETEQELFYYRRRLEELVARRTEQLEKQCVILNSANANLDKALCERWHAEAALRASETRFRLLLESAGDGILGIDVEGRCTFVNRSALAMLGYTQEELLGQDTHATIYYSDAEGLPAPPGQWGVYAAFREGVPHRSTEIFRRKNSGSFPVECSSYPIQLDGQVTGAVLVFRDVTELHALNRNLYFLASHDPLTGLFNRTEFEQRASRVLASAREDQSEHVLCYLDLDQFKIINDTCGHSAGDELLRALGTFLKSKLRQRDTLARLGGDEFALLMEHCSLDQAWRIATELCESIRSYRFVWEGKAFSVGASIGMASLTGADSDISVVLVAADTACYMAKEKGRNRVHIFKPQDDELAEKRAQGKWGGRLTRALDEDSFRLYCQRICRLADTAGRVHYEILLRLVDDDGSLIDPSAFIPAAERHHLMPAIDRWVLRKVIAQIGRGHKQAMPEALPIYAVNISVASLIDDRFVDFVHELLQAYGIPPQTLCFEVDEASTLAHLSQARFSIEKLNGLGCLFSIKNFGSGIAAFTNLKTMPVDFLKMDGEFIKSLEENPINRTIAEAINLIAHVMVIETVGECADSDKTLALLKKLGLDHAQGYAIMAPSPWEELDNPANAEVRLDVQ